MKTILLSILLILNLMSRAFSSGSGHLEITTQDGRVYLFNVEIASTNEERQRGLMFRQKMAEDSGMLFLFPTEQKVAFWMKNTLIPLDLLYIDREGRILQIAKNTVPLSEQALPSLNPVSAVLEINAGLTDRLVILPGDLTKMRPQPSN